MKARELILVGPHGAGKSTLGASLADALKTRFDDEIGRRLMEERVRGSPDHASFHFDSAFDQEVWRLETERDRGARSSGPCAASIQRIVETWHPGNAAYGSCRNPDRARDWLSRCVEAVAHHPRQIIILPIVISEATQAARYSEGGGRNEYRQRAFLGCVAATLSTILTELKVQCPNVVVMSPIANDEPDAPGLPRLREEVLAKLRSMRDGSVA